MSWAQLKPRCSFREVWRKKNRVGAPRPKVTAREGCGKALGRDEVARMAGGAPVGGRLAG